MYYIVDNINNYSNSDYKNFYYKIKDYKKQSISKLFDIESKKRSILGEILLIKCLKYFNIDYNKTIIILNKNNKPIIKNYPYFYSISHSNDIVICIISTNKVGVDIEKIRNIDLNMAKIFCYKSELNYIKIFTNFFELYCLKESYIKLLGSNISKIKCINFIHNNKIISTKNNIKFTLDKSIKKYIIAISEEVK